MLIHASCIAFEGTRLRESYGAARGVLIAGPAGAGKSDLALRLIDGGAQLVADDQTELRLENGVLAASAPESIAGLFEIRHIGLVKMPCAAKVSVALYVDCAPLDEKLERLPEDDAIYLLDHPVKRLRLPAFAASTPAKIRAALIYPLASDRT